MLAKAVDFCAQPMKLDEISFNTPFGTKVYKKLIFSWFSNTNVIYGAIGQQRVTAPPHYPVPRYVTQGFWLEIAYLASPYTHGAFKNNEYYF